MRHSEKYKILHIVGKCNSEKSLVEKFDAAVWDKNNSNFPISFQQKNHPQYGSQHDNQPSLNGHGTR